LFAPPARHLAPRPGLWSVARRGRASLGSARLQAALTALAFVLSSLFGVLHEAATTHVRCAQHGELMDRAAPVASSVAALDRDGRGDRSARVSSVGNSGAEQAQGHEHCALASAMRESRIAPCAPALSTALQVTVELAIVAADRRVARDRGVYRTAPKTSPPA